MAIVNRCVIGNIVFAIIKILFSWVELIGAVDLLGYSHLVSCDSDSDKSGFDVTVINCKYQRGEVGELG